MNLTLSELLDKKKKFYLQLTAALEDDWLSYSGLIEANEFHHRLISAVIYQMIGELEQAGQPMPSVPYAFVFFGSGGRGELTVWSDQDHGLIYTNDRFVTPEVDHYFSALFHKVTQTLECLGYQRCEGNVLATNLRWRRSIEQYKACMDQWFHDSNWENIRYLTIFSDIAWVQGEKGCMTDLRAYLFQKMKEYPTILPRIYENAKKKRVPLGVFGQIVTGQHGVELGSISIKQGMYLPLVKSIRLFALGEGIPYTSTIERIQALISRGLWSRMYGERIIQLFLKVLTLRYGFPKRYHIQHPDYIKISNLDREDVIELKEMLVQIASLQKQSDQYIREKWHGRG